MTRDPSVCPGPGHQPESGPAICCVQNFLQIDLGISRFVSLHHLCSSAVADRFMKHFQAASTRRRASFLTSFRNSMFR